MPFELTTSVPYCDVPGLDSAKVTAWLSASVAVIVPVMLVASSEPDLVTACTTGASFWPTIVTVMVLVEVAPCGSVTV